MIVLGINAFHGDASACLVRDGMLIAAAEEERFRRVKHWAGFPTEAIRYCLKEAGVGLCDVEHVAINQDSRANRWRKMAFAISNRPELSLLIDRFLNKQKRAGVGQHLDAAFGEGVFQGSVHEVEHHLAHLASAFLVSPFERAVAVSVDGFGDFASAAWGCGSGSKLAVDGKIFFPHSLGIFYQALTQYLGFPHYGDEYKVMGLAPYGKPRFMEQMRKIVLLEPDGGFRLNLDCFRHHREKVAYTWEGGEPAVGKLFDAGLEALLGPARGKDEILDQRHYDIARSVQAMYEEAFFHMLNVLHEQYGEDSLVLAGGCAMNSVANGKVYGNTPFKKLYIQSAAGDAGGAIGAALVVSGRVMGDGRRCRMDHAYWGPSSNDAEIDALVADARTEILQQNCRTERIDDEDVLCALTAAAIARGEVIGWFQGRMEWGPRALGNRSILGDPRRADMKDILNLKIKRRESFRPFAPSVLREAVPEWFQTDDDVPFMMQVYLIRQDKRAIVPAVTHVDGTGRLQTVSRDVNPRYHRLIGKFRDISGVPMLLNTSFNENEPVVCTPREALDCFLRTKMDLLVLGNVVVHRLA